MRKTKEFGLAFILSIALVTPVFSVAGNIPTSAEVEAEFSKILKNTKITSIKASPIPGLYEVISGSNVFYFSPVGEGHLLFGAIVDKNGNNLTSGIQEKLRSEAQKVIEKASIEKLKTLDLSQAVKVGNGPNIVIEFTDPDCPYCRKANQILSKYSSEVTRYIFLFPLEQLHPQARTKSLFVHSSEDKPKALHEVFTGRYDKELPVTINDSSKMAEATKVLEGGIKAGAAIGVQGTPMLFINGNMVSGADETKISSLLKLTPK